MPAASGPEGAPPDGSEERRDSPKNARTRFQTRGGRVLETSPPVKSGFNRLQSGQAIAAYAPADPEQFAVIDSSLQIAGYAGMAVAAALACVLSALAGLGVVEASHGGA